MSARRALGMAVLASAGVAVLLAAGSQLPTPPLTAPGRIGEWWSIHGTATASLSVVRVVGLALSLYLAVVSLLGLVAALTKWSWAHQLTRWTTTPGVRRMLIGASLAAVLSAPAVGLARDTDPFLVRDLGAEAPAVTLTDLGAVSSSITLTDIGAAPAPAGSAPVDNSTLGADSRPDVVSEDTSLERWRVEPGDHLWSIATETVADRDGSADQSSIADYWLRLIDANHDVVGDNPDLIHPGQILRLPQ